MDTQEVWNTAYSQLELQFDRASFDTWLRGAFLLDVLQFAPMIGRTSINTLTGVMEQKETLRG